VLFLIKLPTNPDAKLNIFAGAIVALTVENQPIPNRAWLFLHSGFASHFAETKLSPP
jgi:hypothetical protein